MIYVAFGISYRLRQETLLKRPKIIKNNAVEKILQFIKLQPLQKDYF